MLECWNAHACKVLPVRWINAPHLVPDHDCDAWTPLKSFELPVHRGSPLSQKLALREVRQGIRQDLGQCLRTEFRLAAHILRQPSDFKAGVTALLIDKSGPASWQPPTLEEVPPLAHAVAGLWEGQGGAVACGWLVGMHA